MITNKMLSRHKDSKSRFIVVPKDVWASIKSTPELTPDSILKVRENGLLVDSIAKHIDSGFSNAHAVEAVWWGRIPVVEATK